MPVFNNYPSTYLGSSTAEFTRYGAESTDWETLGTQLDTDYLYDSSISSRTWQELYTDDIDQELVGVSPAGGQGSAIERIVVYARCKQDAHGTAATVKLSWRDATGSRNEGSSQDLTTSWAWYSEEWTEYSSGVPFDFGFFPDVAGFPMASQLQIGFGLHHGTVGAFCSELYVHIEYKNAYSTLSTASLGLDASQSRIMGWNRTLSCELGLDASMTRAATYTRSLDASLTGMLGTIVTEKNLATWLVVASADGGTWKTRDGSSWSIAAKDATSASIAGTWLAQFDNRLVTLKSQNSGFAYSLVNDIVSTSPDPEAWTDKPNFPNLPVSFNGMFVGKDASDTPALYFIADDGVYYMDVFSNFTFGKTELSWEPNSNAGKKGLYFKGATYVTVDRGIYELQGGIALPIGPDQDDGLPDDMNGYISDMIGVGFWLVISINGGAGRKSSIMKRHIAGNHWHTVYKTAASNSPINALAWDNGTLYFGEGTNVKSLPLSSESDNVKLLPSYESQITGALIYPRFHSEFEGVPKVAQKLRMVTEGCDANNYFTAYYKVNGAASWTSMGTYTTSPRPTALKFTTIDTGDGLEFEDIQFKIEPTRNASEPTGRPVLVSLTLDYRVVPDVLMSFRFKAVARTDGNRKGSEIIDQLTTTLAKKPLVKFYPSGNLDGASYLVEMTGLPKAQKGTEFGEEGEYDVEVSQVTD